MTGGQEYAYGIVHNGGILNAGEFPETVVSENRLRDEGNNK